MEIKPNFLLTLNEARNNYRNHLLYVKIQLSANLLIGRDLQVIRKLVTFRGWRWCLRFEKLYAISASDNRLHQNFWQQHYYTGGRDPSYYVLKVYQIVFGNSNAWKAKVNRYQNKRKCIPDSVSFKPKWWSIKTMFLNAEYQF